MDEANENRIIFSNMQDAEIDWKDYFWGMREVRYTEREVNIRTIIAYVFAPIFKISTGEIFYGKVKVGSSTCILNGTMLYINIFFENEHVNQKIGICDIANQDATHQIQISDFEFGICRNFDGKKLYVVYYRYVPTSSVYSFSLHDFILKPLDKHLGYYGSTKCLFHYDGSTFCDCSAENSPAYEAFETMVSLQQGKSFDKTEAQTIQKSIGNTKSGQTDLLQSIFCFQDFFEDGTHNLELQTKTIPQRTLQTAAPQIIMPKPPVIHTTQHKTDETPLIHKRKNKFAWLYILFGFPLCLVGAAAICILNLGLFPVSKLFLGIGIALSSIFILVGLRNAFIERIDRVVINTHSKCVKTTMLVLSSFNSRDLNEMQHGLQLEY